MQVTHLTFKRKQGRLKKKDFGLLMCIHVGTERKTLLNGHTNKNRKKLISSLASVCGQNNDE